MIGLLIAIVLFNFLAFKLNKRLTKNQIIHIWTFTIAFQHLFDKFVQDKYKGYWYFSYEIDWIELITHSMVVPPVNMLFLNFYPFHKSNAHKFLYIISWVIVICVYETLAMLPEPWGFFHYGWWNLLYSLMANPILLMILLTFYKIIKKLEKSGNENNR